MQSARRKDGEVLRCGEKAVLTSRRVTCGKCEAGTGGYFLKLQLDLSRKRVDDDTQELLIYLSLPLSLHSLSSVRRAC
jgi:hypothetical protein